MRVLNEAEVFRDLPMLTKAWESRESFLFLPEKAAVDQDWIGRALSRVPKEMETGHYALLTSGTTGLPKLVIGARSRTEQLVEVLHEKQQSDPVAQAVVALPLTYSYAFVNQWVWAKRFGRELQVTRGLKDPAALRGALERTRQGMICLVGVQVPLLGEWFEGASFPEIIRVHFAGGRFPQEHICVVRSLFPNAQVFNNYGCAEALPRLSLRPAESTSDAADIGEPLPGVELAGNQDRELMFRSRYRAVGVIQEGEFMPILPQQWVKTGDLAETTPVQGWRLLGRAGEVFKRYGEKISLPVLLSTIFKVWNGQAAFYRQPDPMGEEGHVLLLAPTPSSMELQVVLRAFRDHHPRAHWPLRIESMPELPLLPNGKPDVRGAISYPEKAIHWRQRL